MPMKKKSLYCWHKKKFRKKYLRQSSIDFHFCNIYRHPVTLFTRDADWHKLVTDLFYDFVSILLVWVAKYQNAIKLENISNLITSPSSYQCIRRKTRLVYFVIHGRHISMECMWLCAYWGSPNVNFQNKW